MFAVSVLPMLYLIGAIASLAPSASYGLAFYILVVVWFVGMGIASHAIARRLNKRRNS
jgi:hypothetical protein